MSNSCQKILAIALTFPLAGCQGIPLKEIRNIQPAYTKNSSKPVNTIYNCLVTEFDEFRADGRAFFLNDVESSRAEISFGAMQMGHFKHYYQIDIIKASTGSQIEIRKSPSKFPPLPEEELISELGKCS